MKLIAFIFFCLVAFFTMQPLISPPGMLANEVTTPPPIHCCAKMMKCPKKSHSTGCPKTSDCHKGGSCSNEPGCTCS